MIVAAHQPGYLPWLGYFDKIARADVFVLLDDVQYEAQNFQNRNRVKVNNGVHWLTVPLVRRGRDERIADKLIADHGDGRNHWRRRTWGTLLLHYRRAPYFARYSEALKEVFSRPWERLVELDRRLIELIMGWLGIATPLVMGSSLELSGQKTDRILDFCRRLDATHYLSGSGASTGYLEVPKLHKAGIEVVWQRFEHPVYPQRYSALGFIPHLCALDLLFNCGPAAAKWFRVPSWSRAGGG